MKPEGRTLKQWRKETPAKHRSFSEKRNRSMKMLMEEGWDA